jgi:hypothetical protein
VERGIDLSHTNYTNNSGVFPGLIEELNRNLKLQEENPGIFVATDLMKMVDTYESSAISIQSGVMWSDATVSSEFDTSINKQLCIVLIFDTYTDVSESGVNTFNQRMDAELAKFRQLDSFPLFTAHNCSYTDDDGSHYGREYAINFGEDAEGAARLISEILIKVRGWSPTDTYDMFTNVGGENADRARNAWFEAHGTVDTNLGLADIISEYKEIILAIIAIIIFVLRFLI